MNYISLIFHCSIQVHNTRNLFKLFYLHENIGLLITSIELIRLPLVENFWPAVRKNQYEVKLNLSKNSSQISQLIRIQDQIQKYIFYKSYFTLLYLIVTIVRFQISKFWKINFLTLTIFIWSIFLTFRKSIWKNKLQENWS